MSSLLRVRDLRLRFGDAKILHGVDFDLASGETLGLVGESGSGKTTTALAVIQLLGQKARLSGSIQFASNAGSLELVDLPEARMQQLRGREIGMVFQDALSALNPVRSIGSQLKEVLWVHQHLRGKAAQLAAVSYLERVGLPEPTVLLARYPHELSGGQRQRALIALALACKPRLLICDEPTSALDVTVQKQVIELLKSLRVSENLSLLFISHDLALTAEFCDRIVVMRQGLIVETAAADALWHAPQAPYTQGLLACRPKLAGNPVRLMTVADFEADPFAANAAMAAVIRAAEHLVSESDYPGKLASETAAFFDVQNLSAGYQARGLAKLWTPPKTVLHDISFSLARGECLGLVGESGSGKTTLARCLMRLQPVFTGSVHLSGTDLLAATGSALRRLRRRFQMVFQDPYSSLNPARNIGQTLLEPLQVHGLHKGAEHERVLALLDAVGLPESALERYPAQFSGGQRQRIAIARALAVEPELLICDECVSALDVSIQAQILNLLKDLQQKLGLSLIFISHDLSVIRFMADQLLILGDGLAVEHGSADAIFANPHHELTKRLLDAVPRGPSR
jgi:peptide/nickel transport system ATP-binding protein